MCYNDLIQLARAHRTMVSTMRKGLNCHWNNTDCSESLLKKENMSNNTALYHFSTTHDSLST